MMAARALLYLGETASKRIFTNVHCQKTRIEVQTTWRHSRGFKRNRDPSKESEEVIANVPAGTLSAGKLWKPFGFAIAFSGATIVGASIWQYENVHKHTHWVISQYHSATQRKLSRSGWRGEAEKWWRSLTDGQRVFAPICFLNVIVFLCWRIPTLKNTMLRYFCANPSSSVMCWPMLFSTFSHYSVLHLAANMYVLHSFSSVAVSALSKEQFVAFYLVGGVVSSLASHVYKIAFGMPGLSIGASGAIMAVVSFVCTQYPETMLSIAFLPMWTFAAGSALKGLMAMDTVGCIFGWKFMDHAAHLGGALFGIFWTAWGNANIWEKRTPIVLYWHRIRNPPKSN